MLSSVLRTLKEEALVGVTEVTEENTRHWKVLPEFRIKLRKNWGGEKTGKKKEAVVKKRRHKSTDNGSLKEKMVKQE